MDTSQQTVPWWGSYDAYFYAYKSESQIGPNAASLLSFIGSVYPSPQWREIGADADLATRKYKLLMLVGHSEGGVLIRSAILRRVQSLQHGPPGARRIEGDGILNANLRLFAPAFWGTVISGYAGLLLRTPVLGSLVESRLHKSAAYKQLADRSPVLKDIRDRTVSLAKKYPDVRAFRARSLFPDDDKIVGAEALETDPPADYEKNQTHSSICKPNRKYLKPLTFVRDDDYTLAVAS
jgi:hypothetical protein